MLYTFDKSDSKESENLFCELYEKYNKLVYSLAIKKLNSHSLAEECVQETFLIVAKKITHFAQIDEGHRRNLICTIARGKAIDGIRKEDNIAYAQSIESVDISYFDSFEMLELTEEIKKLNEKEQTFIFLNFIYGFSNAEIAKMYGVSASYVGKVINTALKQIKMSLEGNRNE